MKLEHSFEQLSLTEKIDMLSRNGVYLMCRKNSVYNIFLYGINGIYVEVLYFRKNNEIQNIMGISTDKAVDMYLNDISLGKLQSN